MKFKVSEEVFKILPNVCFGVVVAKGLKNNVNYNGLEDAIKGLEDKYSGMKAKDLEEIKIYREAFRKLGYNPNKFMPSIESIVGRVLKQKGMPSILPVVDLYNSISMKYLLPIGGHDMDSKNGDIEVRFSNIEDIFTPFGSSEKEEMPEGELVYSVGNEIKTRRWIWRQGELGKITGESENLFFPIDGFQGENDIEVKKAVEELADKVKSLFGCEVKIGFINNENREMEL